jgi:hypothetical protein
LYLAPAVAIIGCHPSKDKIEADDFVRMHGFCPTQKFIMHPSEPPPSEQNEPSYYGIQVLVAEKWIAERSAW